MPNQAKVALIRCESYNIDLVRSAISRGFGLLDGVAPFAKPNEKIVLKANLLVGDPPEKCTTTHPAILQAVAEQFLSAKTTVKYGDSPAVGSVKGAAKKAKLLEVGNALGIELADFDNGRPIIYDKGVQNKTFIIANAILEADGVVSLPKLKTHAFQKMTGCIKNQFGCIPGVRKAEFHVKIPDAFQFAQMLVDLNGFVNPRLYVMDGIMGMEGNGPRGGNLIATNVILMSADPVALDATVCRMMNLDPGLVPTCTFGQDAGMGVWQEDQIELLGDPVDSFTLPKFDVDRKPIKSYQSSGRLRKILNSLIVPKPVINSTLCVKCGVCVNVCPVKPKALSWSDEAKSSPPVYDYSKCIRCYCCQELCPEKAIKLKRSLFRKIVDKL